MAEVKSHQQGMPCWVELSTTDEKGALAPHRHVGDGGGEPATVASYVAIRHRGNESRALRDDRHQTTDDRQETRQRLL